MADALQRSAGAVVFRRTGQGLRLLILRTGTTWDFPGGQVEDGEHDFVAAQREVFEATGLRDLDYPFGPDVHRETLATATQGLTSYFLAETDTATVELPVLPDLGRAAHDEWRWVSAGEAEDLLPPRLAIVLDWVHAQLDGGA